MIGWLSARFAGLFGAGAAGILAHVIGWLAIAAAALAPLYLSYRHGVTVTAAHYDKVIAEQRAQYASAEAEAVKAVQAEERAAAQVALKATEARMRAEQEQNNALQADITSLRSGTLRLRSRLAANRCSADDVRADATHPGRVAKARTAGLLPKDAEFLLRIGKEADGVVNKLTEAQGLLKVCESLNRGD